MRETDWESRKRPNQVCLPRNNLPDNCEPREHERPEFKD
jgi:hypothetical protein